MEKTFDYILPNCHLDDRDFAIIRQLNVLIMDADTRESGLFFILKRIKLPSFKLLLSRVHPSLYTHVLRPPYNDIGSIQAAIFVVHSLSYDPTFVNLFLTYDSCLFDNFRTLFNDCDDITVVAHTLEILLNVSSIAKDKSMFLGLIEPLLTFFSGNVQYRPLAGSCLCAIITSRSNQIHFVQNGGVDGILAVLSSHVHDEQLLATALLLQLIKSPDQNLAVTIRKIVIKKNVLHLIKPMLSSHGTLYVRAWNIAFLLTLAEGYQKRFVQSGIFYDAIELLGDTLESTKETVSYALSIIMVVTSDPSLLTACHGFSLADRLCKKLGQVNLQQVSFRLTLLNTIKYMCRDDKLRSELQSVKVGVALKDKEAHESLEKKRKEILTLLGNAYDEELGTDEDINLIVEYNIKKTQAKQIVEELVTTEIDYCLLLKKIVEEIQPTLELVLSESDSVNIFLNIADISRIQIQFLWMLETRWKSEKDSDWVQLADIFEAYLTKEMKNIYCYYLNRFDAANELFSRLKKTKDVKKLVSELGSKHIFIPTFLILPVQRLPRYLLLIKTLLKNTPQDHTEHQELVKVESMVNDVVHWLNENKREYENKCSLEKWSQETELEEDLNRSFIAEFHQIVVKRKKSTGLITIVIFNDIALFLIQKKMKWKTLNNISLVDLKVFEIAENSSLVVSFPSNEKGTDITYSLSLSNDEEMEKLYEVLKTHTNLSKAHKKQMMLESSMN
ncbi:DH domain-containing protein [Entamoeba marina]